MGGLGAVCGRLEPGLAFDAILVDARPAPGLGAAPYEARELVGGSAEGAVRPPEELLERFLNLGDDRNVAAVFVAGRCVVGIGDGLGMTAADTCLGGRERSRSPTLVAQKFAAAVGHS